MKKSTILKQMNFFLAGAMAALGFASCDKGDVDEPCMYGPPPSEMDQTEPSSFCDVDGLETDTSLEVDINADNE